MLKLHVGISVLLIALSLPVRSEAQDLGGPCIPASERAGRAFGCFIVASLPVGQLERAVFWHAGKSGTVRDIKTSKTGHVTITVVQANGERFKTLAKNVVVE